MNWKKGNIKKVHLVGVCGMGMAGLAGLLKEAGYDVSGSDKSFEPPMGALIKNLGIKIFEGYSPENITSDIDLAVIGNVVTKDHPEAVEIIKQNIFYSSFPETAYRLFLERCKNRAVIAGTHGKTTTAALLSWILEQTGADPTYLFGGILTNTQKNYRLGAGNFAVIEGDEYDTAFFDKRPKFLHYHPTLLIITSLELDHADIYADIDALKRAFSELLDSLDSGATVLWNPQYKALSEVMRSTNAQINSIPLFLEESWQIQKSSRPSSFAIIHKMTKVAEGKTSLMGSHNLENILFAFVAAKQFGIDDELILSAIEDFKGVKKRQEVLGEVNEITVIDDFAHHPTAVEKTICAVRERYRERRIIAVFEPRTNTSRTRIFEKEFAQSLANADIVIIAPIDRPEKVAPENRLRPNFICELIRSKNKIAIAANTPEQILEELMRTLKPRDVVLFMSNGPFHHLPSRTLAMLKENTARNKTGL